MILILSHGNATVERGFSINAHCLVENQHEQSLVAQRSIYDAIEHAGGVEKMEITSELIHAYKNASSLYRESLKRAREKDKQNEDEENVKKRKKLEIRVLEEKKAEHLSELARLTAEIENKIRK